jgi:hypothetical protein
MAHRGRLREIRVLLARMPNLLLDILGHLVASEPDITVVGWVQDAEDLLTAIRRARADVIILGQAAEGAWGDYAVLLFARPTLKVMAIDVSGKTGVFCELRPQYTSLGELSAEVLRDAIRGRPPQPTANTVARLPSR